MAERIEDLNLPNAVISRLMKDELPDGVNIGKDARTAVARAASVFILFLTSAANNAAVQEKRRTITANDIFKALYDTEFDFFVEPVKEALTEFKKCVQVKKENKAAGKMNGTTDEDEMRDDDGNEEPMEGVEQEEEEDDDAQDNPKQS